MRWLGAAGYATWLVCSVPPLVEIISGRWPWTRAVVWLAAFGLFGTALTVMEWAHRLQANARLARVVLLLVQSISGLVCTFLSGNGITAAMFVIVAAQLPHMLPLRAAAAWIAAQTLLNAAIFARFSWINGVTAGFAFGGFQVFAMASSYLAASEYAARRALGAAHAELLATRARLTEISRNEERLRIARDLHDTLGHHLTALSLKLDVASRLVDGKAAAHVSEAHAIARLVLSDVRDVVGQLREPRHVDLVDAIRTLAAATTGLEIHLALPPTLPLETGERLDALLRAVQEIITNSVRHAAARHLWIEVAQGDDGITLQARDDGRGVASLAPGHGLTGMRERFEACAGRVEFHPGMERGFAIRGFIPHAKPAS
jgi:signal transduction histidine kinase